MIPLFHDLEGERVVVVGGGPVARRKARRFASEASVLAVAPSFVDGFGDLDCDRRQEAVTPESARETFASAALVVLATDDASLNDDLATVARDEGAMVNRADEVGDVVVPATAESAEITVAVSTGGASPATSKYLREEIAPLLAATDPMVRIQRALREDLKERVDSRSRRRELLWEVMDSDAVWDRIPDDEDEARELATGIVLPDGE